MELLNLGSICLLCGERVGNPVAPPELHTQAIAIPKHLRIVHNITIRTADLRSRTMWYRAKQRVLR